LTGGCNTLNVSIRLEQVDFQARYAGNLRLRVSLSGRIQRSYTIHDGAEHSHTSKLSGCRHAERSRKVESVIGFRQIGKEKISRVCVELTAVGQEHSACLYGDVSGGLELNPPIEQAHAVAVSERARFELNEIRCVGSQQVTRKSDAAERYVEVLRSRPRPGLKQRVSALKQDIQFQRNIFVVQHLRPGGREPERKDY
jgi:hypothetical protein